MLSIYKIPLLSTIKHISSKGLVLKQILSITNDLFLTIFTGSLKHFYSLLIQSSFMLLFFAVSPSKFCINLFRSLVQIKESCLCSNSTLLRYGSHRFSFQPKFFYSIHFGLWSNWITNMSKSLVICKIAFENTGLKVYIDLHSN